MIKSDLVNILFGQAERSLKLMIIRVREKVAVGRPLVEQGTIQRDIAMSRWDTLSCVSTTK